MLRVVKCLALALRYVAFYVLMWGRLAVHFVTTTCAFFGMLGLALALVLKPEWWLLWKLGAFSFGSFLLGWIYDTILLTLSPEPIILSGKKCT
jgi:hypothetical protein